VRLLDRNRLGAEPTPYGQALLRHGLAAFDELRQGVKEIESLADPTAGEVQIGATEAMVAGLLPVVIDRLYRRYPRLSVNITQASLEPRSMAACASARWILLSGGCSARSRT
jgi:DNA-binding transcriptional LysR family regulator